MKKLFTLAIAMLAFNGLAFAGHGVGNGQGQAQAEASRQASPAVEMREAPEFAPQDLIEAEEAIAADEAAPRPELSKEEMREAKREIRGKVKEAKKEVRALKKQARQENRPMGDSQLLAVILAIILPPLGVLYWESGITTHFWIALLLTLLFYLPGLIYALIIIFGGM